MSRITSILIILICIVLLGAGAVWFVYTKPKAITEYVPPSDGQPFPSPIPSSDEWKKIILKDVREKLGENIITISESDEEYDAPFQFSTAQKLFRSDATSSINSWIDNDNFLFTKYFASEGWFEDFEQYHYDLQTGSSKNIGRESKNSQEWIGSSAFSPDGKFLVSVVAGTPSITTAPNDLGTVSIKNLETGQIKVLGKQTHRTCFDGNCIANSYYYPVWSPNGKYIAFYDDEHWNQEGRGVSVIKSNAKNLSEMVFLGRTAFVETERPSWGEYIFWSPDSAKLFVKDSNVVFSIEPIMKEVYRPTAGENKFGDRWRWSPDSKKILGSTYNSFGFYVLNLNDKKKQGFLLKTDFMRGSDFNGDADWAPDNIHIVYAYNKAIYIINLKTGKHKKIITDQADYKNPRWSPDGKRIIYQKDNEIWMIQVSIK